MTARFNIFAWQRAVRDSAISTPLAALLFVLATYADEAGEAYPSLEQLAAGAKISVSTASRHLRSEAAQAFFTRSRRPNRNALYTLRLPGLVFSEREVRTSQSAKFAEREVRTDASPDFSETQVRTSQSEKSYIRYSDPEELPRGTTQQQQPAREVISLPSGRELQIKPAVGDGADVSTVEDVEPPSRPSSKTMKQRWNAALAAACLPNSDPPTSLLGLMAGADPKLLDEALNSLHPDVSKPKTWVVKILRGQAKRPPGARGRASPGSASGAAADIWTGGRNPRVKATAINQDDNPYRNSGTPTVYDPFEEVA